MMIHEFEKLTGFHPGADLYAVIESAYYDFDGDKQAFCKAYKSNKDGLAEKIARQLDWSKLTESRKAESEAAEKIAELEATVERLQAALDRELEWKPYEDRHNVSQADYKGLADSVKCGVAHYMDDSEALDLIARDFGFHPEWVTIVREADALEIDRHNRVRRTGAKYDRRPVYCATDYYYIRFNVRGRAYEAWNDDLRQYWC